ncbi:tryptophan halogenase family protein [Agarilytica rhodophyticola]|uniref:tryptophan halogenase family protein n=1 Tax=Agarilytica rhodophyticola TaxID=1737490 RepID=UPI000B347C89|nr:tryptophan halogenase family protein [Agarilytica rhodophyticola]
MSEHIENIVIVGAGVTAWLAALALTKQFNANSLNITMIDCEQKESLPLAESGVAALSSFHRKFGIREREVMVATEATFKLANAFYGWNFPEQSFFHSHSPYGAMIQSIEFQHFAAKFKLDGDNTPFDAYSLGASAARLGRFAHPKTNAKAFLAPYSYALHFDVQHYLDYLKSLVQAQVRLIKENISDVVVRSEDGFIDALVTSGHQQIEGDLFIDCSGKSGRLIEQALGVGYMDWSDYLPCDRRIIFSSDAIKNPLPATKMSLHKDGWMRIVPLRNRQCYEFYYDINYLSDGDALQYLQRYTADKPMHDVLIQAFNIGRRERFWYKNCLALGETAGFLGSLCVSSVHTTQSAILRFLDMFPDRECSSFIAEEYNRITTEEYARILDFHTAHYDCARALHSPFWDAYHRKSLPASLAHKIHLFSQFGRFPFYERETFSSKTWISFLLGQNYWPQHYDELVPLSNHIHARQHAKKMTSVISQVAEQMPSHWEYLAQYCGDDRNSLESTHIGLKANRGMK